MYKFFVLLKRDFLNIAISPMLLFYNTVFPLLLILVLSALVGGNYGDSGVNSYDYYGITILIYMALNAATSSANSFMEKSLKTTNLRVMYSPISLSYIYLSKIAATFLFTSASCLLLIAVSHFAFGVNYGGVNTPYIICILLLLDLLSSVAGVLFCCIFKSEELTNKVLSLALNLMALLGGLLFQLDGYGRTVERISWISPAKWVNEGIFRIIYDGDKSFFLPILLAMPALSLILLFLCKLIFKTEDYV